MWHLAVWLSGCHSIMNTSLQKINKIIYILATAYGKMVPYKTNTRPARKSKEDFTMKKEINFHAPSQTIPHLRNRGEKTIPLKAYPTSRNAKIWLVSNDGGKSTVYSLVSYDIFPATYYEYQCYNEATIEISVAPRNLTVTTRKHIYAFIRQVVPPEQRETIINAIRETFTRPPYPHGKYTGEPTYRLEIDIPLG